MTSTPVLTAYYLAAIWVSLYFKWWTLISLHELVYTMPLVIVSYVAVTAISNTQVLSPWMLVFPFYSLAQVLVMPPIGARTTSWSPGVAAASDATGSGFAAFGSLRSSWRRVSLPGSSSSIAGSRRTGSASSGGPSNPEASPRGTRWAGVS